MTESSFPAWLAAEAAGREARGLTRRLAEADRGEPLLDLAGFGSALVFSSGYHANLSVVQALAGRARWWSPTRTCTRR